MHKQQQPPKDGDLCITLHQPWASLLVHGIKRVEGRSWPAPLNVLSERIWIHAASKVPDAATIKAMENFYREVYGVDGVTDIKLPDHYPVSVLLGGSPFLLQEIHDNHKIVCPNIGSVKVVGCLKLEELVSWEELPQGVRLEGQTDYCWLCEEPEKLVVPFQMRGWLKVYNLEKRIAADAARGLRSVLGPAPVKFPLPDLSDARSLQPGSLQGMLSQEVGKNKKLVSTPSLDASIVDARAAANQFKKIEGSGNTRSASQSNKNESLGTSRSQNQGPSRNQTWIKKDSSIATQTWIQKS
ncbi:hypothetical protein L7F22_055705 [Adiantum nelumboides]|nr:hypothetical protein [Adiantum nelumboides]